MKTNKIVVAFVSVLCGLLILTGCTGFNQDPMKDQDQSVKDAVDPSTKLDYEKLPSEDLVKIASDSFTFKEGQQGVIPLKIKSYLAGYKYTFKIENLDVFKGAQIDAANTQMTWTPEVGTIDAGENFKSIYLQMFILCEPIIEDGVKKTYASTQMIKVYVENDISKPIVKSIKFSLPGSNPSMLEEESVRFLTITAEDTDSMDTAGMRPTTIFTGKLAPYTTVTNTRYLPVTKEWEIDVRVDLTGVDITKGMESMPLTAQVINRFGLPSLPSAPVNFTVLTKLGMGMTTFDNSTVLKVGVLNSIPFNIYDPKGESVLTLTNYTGLPVGAQITCEKTTRTFQQCALVWAPALTDVGQFSVVLEMETKSSSVYDTRPPVKSTISIAFKVVAP